VKLSKNPGARGYRQLNSDSLDPDGCLVRSRNFVLIKKWNNRCKTKAAGSSWWE